MERITSRIVEKLFFPKSTSHKGENGRLLVIAGSEKYHGSLIYVIKAASRIVDLVYVLTTKENQELVRKLKNKTAEFIPVADLYPLSISPLSRGRKRRGRQGREVALDCILIGPGMGASKRTYKLVRTVLKSGIRAVLDADALNVLDEKLLKLLGPQHILTPHRGEFERLLKISSTPDLVEGKLSPALRSSSPRQPRRYRRGQGRRGIYDLEKFVQRCGCTIVLKGKIDIVATPSPLIPLPPPRRGERREEGRIKIACNYTGNEGMTKGGTGDVLAGLIAALFCRNDAYTSAAAGVFINGKAGDELYHQVGPFYNAEDLVEQIPKTLWRSISR